MLHYRPTSALDANVPIFITWNLHGAVPQNRYPPSTSESAGKAFVLMDRYLDAENPVLDGCDAEIARMVVDALLFGEQVLRNSQLHGWVVMPNHVHVLLTPNIPLPKLLRALKGFTAREGNKMLERTGEAFWQHESYDHWVRDRRQFDKIMRYIEDNPVRTGLCSSPADYLWSHAGRIAGMAN